MIRLMTFMGLLSILLTFSTANATPTCENLFNTDSFEKYYDSLLDSADDFTRLTRKTKMKFDENSNSYEAIKGQLVVIDYLQDVLGRAEVIKGRVTGVTANYLKIDVNGKIRRVPLVFGVDGITSIAVIPTATKSTNEGYAESFSSLLDSADKFKALSKRGILLEGDQDFLRLIPIGSRVIVDRLDDPYGKAELIKGTLVKVESDTVSISVNGKIRKIFSGRGVDGITSIAVLNE